MNNFGNKTDLGKMREVQAEDAANYAEREQMALLETSALDATNVNVAFECIIKEIYKVSLSQSVVGDDQMMKQSTLSKSGAAANQPKPAAQPQPRKTGITLAAPTNEPKKGGNKSTCCSKK